MPPAFVRRIASAFALRCGRAEASARMASYSRSASEASPRSCVASAFWKARTRRARSSSEEDARAFVDTQRRRRRTTRSGALMARAFELFATCTRTPKVSRYSACTDGPRSIQQELASGLVKRRRLVVPAREQRVQRPRIVLVALRRRRVDRSPRRAAPRQDVDEIRAAAVVVVVVVVVLRRRRRRRADRVSAPPPREGSRIRPLPRQQQLDALAEQRRVRTDEGDRFNVVTNKSSFVGQLKGGSIECLVSG
eukprot:31484-Pelagococcus_subviridis.AAC.17